MIIIYGYLDDKYELRPTVKLGCQFLAVFLYSVFVSNSLSFSHAQVSFIFLCFFGLGVVNGCNLLDGLDTLSIKLNLVTYAIFFTVGVYSSRWTTSYLAVIFATPLVAFYFFNKEPAKVHLGEVGGSFLGFTQLFLASTILFELKWGRGYSWDFVDVVSLSFTPLALPMTEVDLSFLRRLYNRKSPFRGDKLHVHHILSLYKRFSPSNASSIMALFYFLSSAISFTISFYTSMILVLPLQVSILVAGSLWLGKDYWKGDDTLELTPKSLFNLFLKKEDVVIIDTSAIDGFNIEVIRPEEDSSEQGGPDDEDREDKAS